MIQIPLGATVVRFYDRGDGEKSNWKSIDYLLGKVDNENNPINKGF